jgi:hypothetical protein
VKEAGPRHFIEETADTGEKAARGRDHRHGSIPHPRSRGRRDGRTGKREQAQEHLTTATTMFREMGMTYWLEKAETDIAGLS